MSMPGLTILINLYHQAMRHLLLLLACLSCVPAVAAERLRIACGSSVVLDLTAIIGAGRVEAVPLVPAGMDPHSYQPRPEDAANLARCQAVVINGLGFEGWWERLAREAAFPADRLIVAAAGVAPLPMAAVPGHEGHDHGPGGHDPHAFGDVANAILYVAAIRDGLSRIDPASAAHYRLTADLLGSELRALDGWVKRSLATIPAARRVIVTNHDGMQYFAKAYGFTVRSPNTALADSQPSARSIEAIAAFIRREQVPAVFIEHAANPRTVEQVAAEAGVRVGGRLWVDGTPPADAPHTGYRGMVVANVLTLIDGLR